MEAARADNPRSISVICVKEVGIIKQPKPEEDEGIALVYKKGINPRYR
jgi:hypothetical protein